MNGLMVFLLVYVILDIVLTILFCIKVKRCGNSLTDCYADVTHHAVSDGHGLRCR
jgi:hypothetical protein